MQYFVTFLEGLISFLSPCMLPMLPVYLSYFAGNADKKQGQFSRSLAFVLGFSAVFCLLGLFAGTLGALLKQFEREVSLVCGLVVILLGLGYLAAVFQRDA